MIEEDCSCEYADDPDTGETVLVMCGRHYANFRKQLMFDLMRANAHLN